MTEKLKSKLQQLQQKFFPNALLALIFLVGCALPNEDSFTPPDESKSNNDKYEKLKKTYEKIKGDYWLQLQTVGTKDTRCTALKIDLEDFNDGKDSSGKPIPGVRLNVKFWDFDSLLYNQSLTGTYDDNGTFSFFRDKPSGLANPSLFTNATTDNFKLQLKGVILDKQVVSGELRLQGYPLGDLLGTIQSKASCEKEITDMNNLVGLAKALSGKWEGESEGLDGFPNFNSVLNINVQKIKGAEHFEYKIIAKYQQEAHGEMPFDVAIQIGFNHRPVSVAFAKGGRPEFNGLLINEKRRMRIQGTMSYPGGFAKTVYTKAK